MSQDTVPSGGKADAAFIGWQHTGRGKSFALFVVTAADHPSRGSTVSEEGLQKLNLQIPSALVPLGNVFGRRGESYSRSAR